MHNHRTARQWITVRDTSSTLWPAPTSRRLALVFGGTAHAPTAAGGRVHADPYRPHGPTRAEVFVAVTPTGTPPTASIELFRYIGSVTRGENMLSFEPDEGGMQVHYLSP